VHPDGAIRAAAAKEFARLRAFRVSLNQNRAVYDALAALDLRQADPETRGYVDRVLRNYRENAVDRDESTRRTIAKLQADILRLEQEFAANLREPREPLSFASPAELDGVPADWLQRQRRGPNGEVLAVNVPVRFAKNPATRERVLVYRFNQARANHDTATRLIKARHELAVASGYRTYAEFQLKGLMAQSPARVTAFLDSLRKIYEPVMRAQHAAALKLMQAEGQKISELGLADFEYAGRLYREDRFKFDTNGLREYFAYERVRDGIFTIVHDLFGLEFKAASGVPVWDPSVEAYDLVENGRPLGRLYLDVTARAGRPAAGSMHPIRGGRRNRVLAEAAVSLNLKSGRADDPNLLAPFSVRTFFHEMGHALQHLLGTRRWAGTSGPLVERDAIEVPSNFFERWSFHPRVLSTIARHYKTGASLPPELVAMLQAGDDEDNMFRMPFAHCQARWSLALHNQPTGDVDVDAIARQTMLECLPYRAPTAEIHPEASFVQMRGYGAAFYTYPWSQVIAADLETHFGGNLFDRKIAMLYRRTVLEGARSKPAGKLFEEFLGRPFSADAWGRAVKAQSATNQR
jgi:thimet oligopeptidase